jgi:hypothetical protein
MIVSAENLKDVMPFVDIAEKLGIKIVCYDVLMYQSAIDEEIIQAAALLKYECVQRGIDARIGEVGAIYRPADRIGQRIDQGYQDLHTKHTKTRIAAQARSGPALSP